MKVFRIGKQELTIKPIDLIIDAGKTPESCDGERAAYRVNEKDALTILQEAIVTREIDVSNEMETLRNESRKLYEKRLEVVNRLERVS